MTQKKRVPFIAFAILLFSILAMPAVAAAAPAGPAQKTVDDALAKRIDAVMAEIYKPGEPGAAIIVRKDGRTIFRKGYGMADMELGVPVEPDMVFRLGSITKQFTAVSVLILAEQGKLSLQDEITKFLPDLPTQGRTITIEHLLTHTSGLKSYTNLSEWLPLWRKDMSVREIIDLTKDKPMEFAPGERWNYNNTGYVLLGAVIEKVSGLTYEDYVNKMIFGPLGMKHSYYGNTERIIPRRIPGYQMGKDGFVNAPYLSMTQPYAASALLSSVDDLGVWNEAVFSGKLVKKEWLDKAFTPYPLKNGESTGYGYGWFIANYQGHRIIEHGGGIHGFSTYEMTLPEDRIFLAILTNSAVGGRDPEPRAFKIATLLLGKPEPERKAITLPEMDIEALVGVYENADGQARYITRERIRVFLQRAGDAKYEIMAASPDEFFFLDRPTRIRVVKNAAGEVSGLRLEARIGPAETWTKTAKPLPAPKKEIAVDTKIYDLYVGEYELAPGSMLVITKEGDKLMGQAYGEEKVELFPESETRYFLKVADAQVEFVKDGAGKVTGLVFQQAGQKMNAPKIR
jgi:CubicO group peptidase (beta-lactamase class C family)